VPNGFFLGANVINITRQTARVIIINVRVRYEDFENVPAMTNEMEAYLRAHDAIIQPPKRPIRVHLRDVKDDHAAVRIEAHSHVVKKDAFLNVNQEITLAIFAIHKKHCAGPAWPVQGLMQLAPPNYTEE
jgi:small-conductance mechanosensitive channel